MVTPLRPGRVALGLAALDRIDENEAVDHFTPHALAPLPARVSSRAMPAAAPRSVAFHRGDLPGGLNFGRMVAVDTETTGLDPSRDKLCVVQLSAGDGSAHVVQLQAGQDCPNLRRVLTDRLCVKLFHYARFDLGMIRQNLGVTCRPVRCTKLAAKLAMPDRDQLGLKDLCRDLLGLELNKDEQTSDWSSADLSAEQIDYAAADVQHLHAIWSKLDRMLKREGRSDMANACFDFLPVRAEMDLAGLQATDPFSR